MKLKPIEVFTKDEVEQIHSASIQLLTDVGMKIDAQDARNIMKQNGAIVEDNSFLSSFLNP